MPNLLVDISQTGLAAALQEKLFQPGQELKKDFYAELPIKIRLTGSYHEFGQFVSGIAALPRIVTLHDIQITPSTGRVRLRSAAAGADRQDLSLPRRRRDRAPPRRTSARPTRPSAQGAGQRMRHSMHAQDAPIACAACSRSRPRALARAALACIGRDADLQQLHRRDQAGSRAGASSRCRRSSRTRPSPTPTQTCARRSCRAARAAVRAACGRTSTATASFWSSSRSTP